VSSAPPVPEIRGVLFDVAGVLSGPLAPAMVAAVQAAAIDLSAAGPALLGAFATAGDGDEPVHRLERGEITLDAFFAGLGEHETAVRLLLDPASPHFGMHGLAAHEDMHAFVREVRASGRRVGVISNAVREWQPAWDRVTPARDEIDALVLSWEVGARKPNAAIYAMAAEALGLDPGHIVMLDDFPAMVDGARSAGMHAIHVADHGTAIAEARALLDLR
jgi:putative hydrolase of the HAD superfamily